MTEPMATTTGPQYMRDVAMGLRRMGFPISAPILEQLAALWEADLERASRDHDLAMSIMAERLTRAERAEAALEQVQNALLVRDHQYRTAQAALEQARVLLAELAACGYECEAGALENNQAYRDLAALLAPEGGAA